MAGDIPVNIPNGNVVTNPDPQRTYQVVVAATQNMGIGKDGKLPWRLPCDIKFFKDVTLTTSDHAKKNAVIMGRKTWESIPLEHRPLPGRLNVVLTRSGSFDIATAENVVICGSMASSLELLAASPYCISIEKVFVIGGGQILREALNAPGCDAIHITEIETIIECDTFIPAVDMSVFLPWYSSFPLVENNIRYHFTTYVRVRNSTGEPLSQTNGWISDNSSDSAKLEVKKFSFLPKMIFDKHEEYMFLRLVQDIISNGTPKDDETGTRFDQLLDIIFKIKNKPDDRRIILSAWNPSDLKSMVLPPCHMFAQFYVANGELSCQMYQRSADMGLGVPFNIASYALLTCMIAHICDLVPGDFVHVIGDAHVYVTHIRPLQEQVQKLPKPFPILKINPHRKDINSFVAADFNLIGCDPYQKIDTTMAV
ncbi:hypothetical protein U1Q18_034842 [Sarracenia purpurea var. burkii]